jgi:hypothetical protein
MADVDFRFAWRKNDPALEAAAIDFWTRLRLLPRNVAPEQRARELCTLAIQNGQAIALTTATIEPMKQFRCRMVMYRLSAQPAMRRRDITAELTDFTRLQMEEWSLQHPEEGAMGLCAIIQGRQLVLQRPSVFWPAQMTFMGYTETGHQVRVAWFRHATVSPEWPPRPSPELQQRRTNPTP